MQEISNLIIERTVKFLDSSSLFQIEPEEAFDKVSNGLATLKEFKLCYQNSKEALPSYFKTETPKYWTFRVRFLLILFHHLLFLHQDGLIFERLDVFLERLKVLNEFCSTSHQIFKLQKVEIGGIGGRILSEEIKKINDKFRQHVMAGQNKCPGCWCSLNNLLTPYKPRL